MPSPQGQQIGLPHRQVVGAAGFAAVILDTEAIPRIDLLAAQQHAIRQQMQLADALVALGLLSERDSYSALATAAGLDAVDLAETVSRELAVRLVPERLARRHFVVPLSVGDRVLTYGTCRPFDCEADAALSCASGRRTHMLIAPRSAVIDALDRCYPRLRDVELLTARLNAAFAERPNVESEAGRESSSSDSAVIDLCNHVLGRAVDAGASDVHIECGGRGTAVRYRIGGVLEPVITLPASVSLPVRNRFKVMARADTALHHRPQDGAFHLRVNGRPIEIRLSIRPTIDGEKLVMRVLDSRPRRRSAEPPAMHDGPMDLVARTPSSVADVECTLIGNREARVARTESRVLVADDDSTTRLLVRRLLERAHYKVLEAGTGREAVETALRERPDLLMLDLNMPVMNGYETISRLRRNFSLVTLPVMVLTAEDGFRVEQQVLDLGADDYLVKPFDPDVLLARVNAVFRRIRVTAA